MIRSTIHFEIRSAMANTVNILNAPSKQSLFQHVFGIE